MTDKLKALFYNSDSQVPVWLLHVGTIIKIMSQQFLMESWVSNESTYTYGVSVVLCLQH